MVCVFMEPSAQAKQSKGGEFCRRILWLPALWVWQRCQQCLLLRPAATRSRLWYRAGPGSRGPCWASPPALPGVTAALPLPGTVPRALHSCLWCQHLEQTHPDHPCVTERPLVHIGLSFGWKVDCPAAFESCDITVSNSYIYIYVYRYYSFLNSETLCAQTEL